MKNRRMISSSRAALSAVTIFGGVAALLSGCAVDTESSVGVHEQRLCTGSVYEAEDMFHQVGGAIADGWNVWSEGYISQTHDFDGQPTEITITAAGQFAAGQWPRMRVTVAGGNVYSPLVDSANWKEFTFTANVPAGTHEVRIYFVNDYYQNGQDRNLLVDKMVVGCTDTAVCGDGVVDAGEECDDGNTDDTDGCSNACMLPVCGDGLVQSGEQCDDGNSDDTDGCTSACELETCGDGVVDPGEACDDGNTVNTDYCTNVCQVSACGDGFLQLGEECDDGNSDDTDGCTSACMLPVCGDGFVQAGEECDDGNSDDADGCSNACELDTCGDGIVDPGEECDDANDDNTDSCSDQCILAVCGDGVVQLGEQCDDGNTDDLDACNSQCRATYCGDGIVNNGEECDDSDRDNADECTNACLLPVCGDGYLQAGEECDDGNADDEDGCTSECLVSDSAELGVTISNTQDWGAGYCATATLTNGAATTTASWNLVLDLNGGSIYTSWGGQYQYQGNQVTITPFDWNDNIAPGQSNSSVGFCVNRNGGGFASLVSVSGYY